MAKDILPTDDTLPCCVRAALALEAAWEIEVIAQQLIEMAAKENSMESLLYRGIAIRLRDLSHVQMSALHDSVESVRKIAQDLRGLSSVEWEVEHG